MNHGPHEDDLHIGQPPTRTTPAPRPRRRGLAVAAVVGVPLAALVVGTLVGLAMSGAASSAAEPAPTVTVTETVTAFANTTDDGTGAEPAEPEPVAGTIPEGTHRVPQDVKPGTYRTSGGEGCYWARLSSLDGDSIIANNLSDGPMTVTIKRTDKGFETSNCADWKKV